MLVSKRAFSTGPTLVLREVRVFVDFLQRLSLRDLFAHPFQKHVVKLVGFVEELDRGRPAVRGNNDLRLERFKFRDFRLDIFDGHERAQKAEAFDRGNRGQIAVSASL